MPFIWMLIAGSIAGTIAKLLQPHHPVGGLLIVGIGGAMITGLMLYSVGHSGGFAGLFIGAAILLAVHVLSAKPDPEKPGRSDSRKAA